MSDIFHTLAYASTIRNSVTGPLSGLKNCLLNITSKTLKNMAARTNIEMYGSRGGTRAYWILHFQDSYVQDF
jgi:hypothetical protein